MRHEPPRRQGLRLILALLFAAFAPLQQLTIRSFSQLACVSLTACACQECQMVEFALGQKQKSAPRRKMSAPPPKADIRVTHRYVCFGPKTDSRTAANSETKRTGYGVTVPLMRERNWAIVIHVGPLNYWN